MKTIKYLCCLWFLLSFASSTAQITKSIDSLAAAYRSEKEKPQRTAPLRRKFRYGLHLTQAFSTFRGPDLPESYFIKPCIGGGITLQYYLLPYIGIGSGLNVQQGGAGIRNEKAADGSSPFSDIDADPTYLERLRMSALEIPLLLHLRTPDILKSTRIIAAGGISYWNIYRVTDVILDPINGNHQPTSKESEYLRNEINYHISLGGEVDVGDFMSLQVSFFITQGTRNVFASNQGKAHSQLFGVRLIALF